MSNNQQFEKLSFWQLLAKKDNAENPIEKIEIPIIQRDYAQGREKQDKIRTKFLDALYNAIYMQSVELDFVYGSESKSVFQPLDGQQRLTTLFLLHWYIATKEKKIDNTVKEKLRIFTYETRTSSREFCNELVDKGIEFEEDKPVISDNIKNSAWFVSSWKKDPTISAMLIMLDDIHEKFSKSEVCWERLISNDNPPITFLYVRLENFGLSDDLYVKMNARGKQLTSFENFKSRFGKHIVKNGWEKDITNPEDKFEHRIDTIWTDLFWKYKGEDKEIDKKLINFIAGIAINNYAENYQSPLPDNTLQMILSSTNINNPLSSSTTPIEKRIAELAKDSNSVIPEDFYTEESFNYLKRCLNQYAEKEYDLIKPNIPLWSHCDENLFKDLIVGEKISFSKRILFYAQTEYLLNNDFVQITFNDWMRVVRNIVENNEFNHADLGRFTGPIQLIKELSNGCSNIYDYLSTHKVESPRAKEQVKQEIEKAKIIVGNSSAKIAIQDIEDTNFSKGEIEFVLYCVGYDIEKDQNPHDFNVDEFKNFKNIITEHLNDNDVTNDFRRAFFTIKDNDFYDYWQGNLKVLDYYDYKSKRHLIKDIKDLKDNFSNNKAYSKYRNYLKDLVVKLSRQNINEIIEEFEKNPKFIELPSWKQKLIKTQGLLDYSKKHYIAIKENDVCCHLLPGSKILDDVFWWEKTKEIK